METLGWTYVSENEAIDLAIILRYFFSKSATLIKSYNDFFPRYRGKTDKSLKPPLSEATVTHD